MRCLGFASLLLADFSYSIYSTTVDRYAAIWNQQNDKEQGNAGIDYFRQLANKDEILQKTAKHILKHVKVISELPGNPKKRMECTLVT